MQPEDIKATIAEREIKKTVFDLLITMRLSPANIRTGMVRVLGWLRSKER